MYFQYTDEHLNNLNQDYAVYSVNEEFSSRKKTKQVVEKSNIDPKNETNTITTSDGQEFRVVATKSDPERDLMDWQLHLLSTANQIIKM